ncbi:MAG TPA: hypothetical protein ENI06_10045, partial [Spirochaetales bacterium]|nr:hypothetical protein [Spirochaetales bacterium]
MFCGSRLKPSRATEDLCGTISKEHLSRKNPANTARFFYPAGKKVLTVSGISSRISLKKTNMDKFLGVDVSLNPVVARHIEDITGNPVTVDEWSHLYGSLGAALGIASEQREENKANYIIDDLFSAGKSARNYFHEPLELKLSNYPDFSSRKSYLYEISRNFRGYQVEVDIYEFLPPICEAWLGVDIGSTSTKAVLLDEKGEVLAGFYTATAGQPLKALQAIFEAIKDMSVRESIDLRIQSSGTTGSGRKFIGRIMGADLILDEITAHARAAGELDPEVDTIIEIGGQDSKFTTLRKGTVTSSTMNNVCAAGTGSFLEEQAKKKDLKRKYCYYSQYAPTIIKSRWYTDKILSPLIR